MPPPPPSPSLLALLLLLLLFLASSSQILGQSAPHFLFSRRDIVDKSVEPRETFLSAQDFENMPKEEVDLRKLGIRVDPDPTLGSHNQGDIAEPAPAKRPHFDANGIARNSIRQTYRRWPRNEIPYALSSQYGAYSRSVIAKAMEEYHSKTCIRFVPRDARRHRDYVYIHPDDGCYSLVGRTGGRQPLSLDSGCIQLGTIVHELMHAVGFFHEQSRYDRDQYIQILWPNVLRGADDQFEKYSYTTIDQLGEPYDYGSIMHYGAYAFSANGKRTIVPRRTGSHKMGQRIAFSETDLRKINKLYQCDGTRATPESRGSRPVQQETGLPAVGGGGEECEDRNWRCIFWSLPVFQYCEKSEAIRKEICPSSCGTCLRPSGERRGEEGEGEEGGQCTDKSAICAQMGREQCPGLMGKLFCQKTCGNCQP